VKRADWNTVPIKALYEGLYDGPHATPKPSASGPVFLGIRNVTDDGRLDLGEIRHIAEDDFPSWTRRVEPRPGDLVFTYEATLNRYAIIPEGFRGCLGRRMALIRPNPKSVDVRFLLYYFFTDAWRAVIKNTMLTGATVDRIPLTNFPNFPVSVPPLPVQRRIAGILSAYDELIENSQRRIRILEAMTRALYREWFVEFRFPDHEAFPRVASPLGNIPRGWEVADLAKTCAEGNGIQTGPFGSQLHECDYSDEGVPVVMPKDLIDFRIRTDRIARIPEELADKLGRHRMLPGDIIYGRRGDIGRRAYLMRHQAGWFCGTGCLRMRPNPRAVNGWYLFHYLGQDDVVGCIAGRAQGVTMPNLNTGVMASVPVKVPPRRLQDAFARLTFPMAEARENLTAKIENLRRTRDLLLPRLLSGQVDLADAAA
jgi:type I restriction enzyme S subunit